MTQTTTALTPDIKPGRYRHYKGPEYQVYELAKHSETEETLVVYRCLYGDFDLWVRPLSMFTESVTINGEQVPRFAFVSGDQKAPALGDNLEANVCE
ncbi:MAG: hypothetical protein COA42_02770 [Alteromonadaceae bacterium]|nr:MAG: hypothetical protein COA42_02770 [Alteromonadaceae bacterium]